MIKKSSFIAFQSLLLIFTASFLHSPLSRAMENSEPTEDDGGGGAWEEIGRKKKPSVKAQQVITQPGRQRQSFAAVGSRAPRERDFVPENKRDLSGQGLTCLDRFEVQMIRYLSN